ncbi:MAG: phosphoglucosamine mutase [Candidatus Bathyarchaeia archaeon]
MNLRLFGTSGIRGVANVDVTPAISLQVGAALASTLRGGEILVGRDVRLTGEMLEAALISGILSCGGGVKRLGILPTPSIALLTKELEADSGVSLTASHNPPQYNGIKLFSSTGMAYTTEQQMRLGEIIERGEFKLVEWDATGSVVSADERWRYIEALADKVKPDQRDRIVCDLFNGSTCTVAPRLFEEAGVETIIINGQPDGHFPSGTPEPTPMSLRRLGRMVEAMEAGIGFAFDGDGDRMMAVDEKGRIPSQDTLLAAYSRYIVEKRGGGLVVTHIGASMCIDEAVSEVGGAVARTRVGDVCIAEEMMKRGAIFGGEPIGAWIHPDIHLCPDGLLSALKLLEALEGRTLSEFMEGINEYPILNTKLDCREDEKEEVMRRISSSYPEVLGEAEVTTVDGLRLDFEDGWVLIRASGTEPAIRITTEARELEAAKGLLKRAQELVSKALRGIA